MQGVWRQEQRRALWRHHVRGLQRILQAVAVFGSQLPMPQKQELCRGPGQQEQVSVLSATEMPQAGNEPGRSV
nr:unnamed protein product [Callosobruchus analis]